MNFSERKKNRQPKNASSSAPYSVEQIRELLTRVASGKCRVDEALTSLRNLPAEELGFATLDHHRSMRKQLPEVVYCESKTPQQVATITQKLVQAHGRVLGTRANPEHFAAARKKVRDLRYDKLARVIWVDRTSRQLLPGVAVLAAGTSDLSVAEEACLTLQMMGHRPERIYDVGVAGLHRLLPHINKLQEMNALVVIAGMEGALPSVIGGFVSAPIIAVPTSVGYGASFGGVTALLAMLNSCASGISVVNIDNGFGGAYAAGLINSRVHAAAHHQHEADHD